jgi:LytS/YehU family sensor histidine kinase
LSDAYGRLGRTDSSDFYFRKYSIVKDVVLDDQAKGKMAAYNYAGRIEAINREKKAGEIELQKQTLFKNILIAAILILTAMAFFIFRNVMLRRKYEARRRELAENELRIQKLESEKYRAELLQQQSELEMKALRAQMNPHFIFNCLNSINQFISVNDAGKATTYLTKFARLIRMVLEKSGKPFIPLDQELNALKLYMDLEAIRFEKPFHYGINDHGMDASSVLIPSLLIQPFVENAIWHGIYPNKERPGMIQIDLRLDKNILHCDITDNGIGMERSAALKKFGSGNKKSMGFEITSQRLKLVDPLDPENSGYSIQDIQDEAGQNAGTRVSIHIPVKYY